MAMTYDKAGVSVSMPQGAKKGLLLRWFASPPYLGWSILSAIVTILVWEFLTRILKVPTVILPAPSMIVSAFYEYARSGAMFIDTFATFRRVVVGLLIGGTVGCFVGLLMGWYPKVKAIMQPIVSSTFPIPKIALLPLFILWFGIGDAFKIALVATGVFYIVLVNAMTGVATISKTTVMAAQNLGANDFQLFYKIIFPGALPVIMAGVRVAFAIALVLEIAGEMVLSRDGIGSFLVSSGQVLDVESIFAALTVTALMGVAGYAVIEAIERYLLPRRHGAERAS